MMKDTHSSQINTYAVLVSVVLFAVLIFNVVGLSSKVLLGFLGLVLFFIAFLKTDFALVIIIFSMLLSPEISLGGIPGRAVVIRMEDLLLCIVFAGWLARMAVNKEIGLLRVTPLNRPIFIFIALCLISTLIGSLRGTVRMKYGIFYLIKYVEYFFLYFMVTNNLKDRKQIRFFIFAMLFVAIATAVFGWQQHLGGVARVTAPFEGERGEPNTLGGYILFIMMITTGLLLNVRQRRDRILLIGILCILFPVLLFTQSRSSWFSMVPAVAVLMVLTPRGRVTVFLVAMGTIFLFSSIFPRYVYERITYTFQRQTERQFLGKRWALDESSAARVDILGYGYKTFVKTPLFGRGAGTAGYAFDNQYVRMLIEFGIFGTLAFFWILMKIYRCSIRSFTELRDDRFAQGLIAGFIAGFAGLLVHCFGAATFIIVRIMEPFWFITAIVVMLPEVTQEEKAALAQG